MSDTNKYVYSFGDGKAEGKADMKALLGGKGANLAEMSVIGIPVPPGFTITTEVCAEYYENGKKLPDAVRSQVDRAIALVEKQIGLKLGDPVDPLLVSVRSGAALSMPGMMNTILNLGLSDVSVEGMAKKTGNVRFAYDGYRRLIDMFGSVVMGVDHEHFEHELHSLKEQRKVKLDTDLSAMTSSSWWTSTRRSTRKGPGRTSPKTPRNSSGRRSWPSSIAGREKGDRIPPDRADHWPQGDRGQRPGDGLRQHGR